MADFSRDPREHWLKPRFSKNEVAKSGLPRIGSAAGVALGVDRLVMALTGAKTIDDVRAP